MLLIKINMLEKFSIWFLIVSLILGHIPNILLSRYFGVQFSFYLYDIIIFFIFVQSLFLFKYRNYFVDVLLLLFFLVNLIFLFFNFYSYEYFFNLFKSRATAFYDSTTDLSFKV